MATPQPAILDRVMGKNQWYVHLSRVDGADLTHIRRVLKKYRQDCEMLQSTVKTVIAFGPTLLRDLAPDSMPDDFQPYETFRSIDGSGREAKGTQEELLLWINSDDKGDIWQIQYDARTALDGHMKVARETPTFILKNSLDMSGFIDGTGNPEAHRDREVGIVPDGQPGAGGSFIIAQRWVHDLKAFHALPIEAQEQVFGRRKSDSERFPDPLPPTSHVAHVELREGKSGDSSRPKRDEITRRSTPYAFHDGTVGLYFMGFCKSQAPLRERMNAMYGIDGSPRDALTDYSNPASGSFYFAPSVEVLDAITRV